MSNALYDAGRNAFLTGAINWTSDIIKVVGCTSSYSPNLSTDTHLSDIPSGDRVATATLSSATASAGIADASDVTFSSVTGSAIAKLVVYKDTGTESTSTLIALIDTATGLPVTPNGGDIQVQWDNGSNKVFKL